MADELNLRKDLAREVSRTLKRVQVLVDGIQDAPTLEVALYNSRQCMLANWYVSGLLQQAAEIPAALSDHYIIETGDGEPLKPPTIPRPNKEIQGGQIGGKSVESCSVSK